MHTALGISYLLQKCGVMSHSNLQADEAAEPSVQLPEPFTVQRGLMPASQQDVPDLLQIARGFHQDQPHIQPQTQPLAGVSQVNHGGLHSLD